MSVDALVLAGGSTKGLTTDENIPTKALIDIGDRPMIEYTLDALKGSREIDNIIVVLPSSVSEEPWFNKIDEVVHADGSLTDNFYAGLGKVVSDSKSIKKVLAISADVPLLTAEAVDDFLDRCTEENASIYYPIVAKEDMEAKYPDVERTYMRLYEGKFTGGNLFLFDPRIAVRNKEALKKASEARKSPLKLIRILGFEFIVKFVFHWLTVRGLERKVSEVIGAKGVAVNTPYVEISIDVDKESDLELVKSELAKRGQ